MESDFEKLLSRVYSWWPKSIGTLENLNITNVREEGVENYYESQIAPHAQVSGSRLLEQLDWIVYGTVCSILKVAHVAYVDEIRKDYLKNRFHHLLLTVGVGQLTNKIDADGSFDLAELASYLKSTGLHE